MNAHRSVLVRAVRALIPLTLLLAGCSLQPTAYAPGAAPWDQAPQVGDWKDIAGIKYVPARHDLPWAESPYIGDWKEGEKLAQNGRGMTWTDASAATTANGGNCYNCHQLSKAEISYGTIGPSLYNYGKLRGVADPASAAAKPIVEYTWAKLYNAKAYNACSGMPRFGHAKMLDEAQLKHLMALLLDPKSPVNQ